MATLTVTMTAGTPSGSLLRRMAIQLEKIAGDIPDVTSTGASMVLTIDNAPSAGTASFQITAGPYTSSVYYV